MPKCSFLFKLLHLFEDLSYNKTISSLRGYSSPFSSLCVTVWWCKVSQQWDHRTPVLSRCSVLHLPSVPQSSAPPSMDRHPTQAQTASVCTNSSVSCAVLHMRVCVVACVCFCVSTSACLCQASPERPGNQRKNRTGHYLNSLQQNFWRVFLKHDTISGTLRERKYWYSLSNVTPT